MTCSIQGDEISRFRLKVLRQGIALEIKGMKKRGQSCYAIVKQEFGFKGNKQRVLEQLDQYIHATERSLGE